MVDKSIFKVFENKYLSILIDIGFLTLFQIFVTAFLKAGQFAYFIIWSINAQFDISITESMNFTQISTEYYKAIGSISGIGFYIIYSLYFFLISKYRPSKNMMYIIGLSIFVFIFNMLYLLISSGDPLMLRDQTTIDLIMHTVAGIASYIGCAAIGYFLAKKSTKAKLISG